MGEKLNLLDAIQLAKQAEQQATALYSDAAQEATNPLVRRLFEHLAKFEDLHYTKLVELEESLRSKGAFVKYEAKESSPTPSVSEVQRIGGVEKTSALKVMGQAMGFETKAAERYRALAAQTSDADGRKMFERLAREEQDHYQILQTAYYDISNLKPLA
jgi:rubrerythrin